MATPQSYTFPQRTKHGRLDFHPGVKYAFEESAVVDYFTAAFGIAKASGAADVTIASGEAEIDPATVYADGPHKHQPVLGGDV